MARRVGAGGLRRIEGMAGRHRAPVRRRRRGVLIAAAAVAAVLPVTAAHGGALDESAPPPAETQHHRHTGEVFTAGPQRSSPLSAQETVRHRHRYNHRRLQPHSVGPVVSRTRGQNVPSVNCHLRVSRSFSSGGPVSHVSC